MRLLSLILVGLMAAGCSGNTAPAAELLPFSARSYPVDGPAKCGVSEDGTPEVGLKRITSVNELTVKFELCAPDIAFLEKISLTPFQIDDSGYLQAHAQDGVLSLKPNGTGPFSFSAWERESQIVLTRNKNYWGDKALAESMVFQWQQDAAARLIQLQAGTVDGIDNISPNDAKILKSDSNVQVLSRPSLSIMYMGFNNTMEPFTDVRVRQALAMALDRKRIVETFYPNGSEVATHFTPCAIPSACGGTPWYDQDLAEAKRLLAEAGYPNGFSTTIAYRDVTRRHTPYPTGIAVEVQAQLAQIGVIATLDLQESTIFQDNRDSGKLTGIFLGGFGADYVDATNFMDYFFGPQSGPRFGVIPEALQSLVSSGATTGDTDKRAAFYAEANEIIRSEAIVVPIAFGSSAVAFRSDVANAEASPLGNESFAPMKPGDRSSLVFLQNVEPGGLYCADEGDFESYRICSQINETLFGLIPGETELRPLLAESCDSSKDLLTWTCTLRPNVRFHNGATLDASDVLDSFAAIWDCASPLHKGRTGIFRYWGTLSSFLNEERCASN